MSALSLPTKVGQTKSLIILSKNLVIFRCIETLYYEQKVRATDLRT